MRRLCLIAGRGGSKRLPRKNVLPLYGKPLIAHTVEQAKLAGMFDLIAISSDDGEILEAAKTAGAEVVIERPANLATDSATSFDVIRHAILQLAGEGQKFDSITFLQVTSPLRLPQDIMKAIEIFEKADAPSLLSVVKEKRLNVDMLAGKAAYPAGFGEDIYNINGSIYIWDIKTFMSEPKHIYADTKLMVMPRYRSVDIDYKADFDIAAQLMESGDYIKEESYELIL